VLVDKYVVLAFNKAEKTVAVTKQPNITCQNQLKVVKIW
jgi:hypothetical protein